MCMILKLRTLDMSWQFFDNISRLEHNPIELDPKIHTGFEDLWRYNFPINDYEPQSKRVAIHCLFRNGHTVSYCTQESAFALNDEGKTIERIN